MNPLEKVAKHEAETSTVAGRSVSFPLYSETMGRPGKDLRLMDRNYLLGRDGDRMNAILAACGYNLRKLLRLLLRLLPGVLFGEIFPPSIQENCKQDVLIPSEVA